MLKKLEGALLITLCFCMVIFSAACNKTTKTVSSEDVAAAQETDSAVLVGFDEETGRNENNDSSQGNTNSESSKGGKDTTEKNTTDNTAQNVKKIEMGGSDPFSSIPSKLRGTTVVFAHFGDEGATEYQKVAKAFTEKTGIKIQWVSYDQGTYVDKVNKQINNNAGPDIVICNSVFPTAVSLAQPLQGLLDLKDSFWDKNISDIATIDGNTYFVNSLESVWENIDMVFYNKNIFSINGLTSPADYYKSNQWTYENFKQCLVDVKGFGKIGGFVDPDKLATSMGEPAIKYDIKTNKYTNNCSNLVESYKFAAEIFKEGLWSSTDWWGTFANGNIGVYMSGLYGAKYNGFFKEMDNSAIAAVPMPTSYQGKPCKQTAGFRGYGIARKSKNPAGAAYFLRYFLDYKYYKAAGANVFKNATLEKVYFDQVVKEVKSKGCNFDLSDEPMGLAGQTNRGMFMGEVRKADPSAVPVEIGKIKNVFQNATDKANEKISFYKK